MIKVTINDDVLRQKAEEGMDAFVGAFVDAINEAIGGTLTADNMAQLNADQITLLAWDALHEEVMDGGFVQLIHNGYGGFIFRNPVARMMRMWGIDSLATLLNKARKLYDRHHEQIERECSDEEFMALFEQMPAFDELDDAFVENEEQWTQMVACYIDDHLDRFATIID